MPVVIICCSYRSRSERPNGEIEENIGSGILKRNDLWIECLVRYLVRNFLDDQCRRLLAQPIAHSREILFAGIVIRVQYCDLCGRLILQNIFRIGQPFASIGGKKSHSPWKMRSIVENRGTRLHE